MKKLVKFLLPIFVASSTVLVACKKKENKKQETTKVLLSYGDMHATKTKEITIDHLNNLVKAKENFLFVVNTNTCGCWQSFEPNLNSYLSKNKALCYRITYDTIKSLAPAYGLNLLSSSTTTFAIFENGKLKTSLCTSDDSDIMYDEKSFAKYMSETIILPGCYFITKDDVSTIKSSGKNAVIYFMRNGCGDCQKLDPGILRTYIKNHLGAKKIYALDCEEYWKDKTDPDYDDYLEVKNQLGLSIDGNPTYGYSTGVFPYFSYISNNNYASGCVIYNQRISKSDDKYLISSTYYTSEMVSQLSYTNTVLLNKEVPQSDLNISGEYAFWKDAAADKVYQPILNSFLDTYLKNTTFTF